MQDKLYVLLYSFSNSHPTVLGVHRFALGYITTCVCRIVALIYFLHELHSIFFLIERAFAFPLSMMSTGTFYGDSCYTLYFMLGYIYQLTQKLKLLRNGVQYLQHPSYQLHISVFFSENLHILIACMFLVLYCYECDFC